MRGSGMFGATGLDQYSQGLFQALDLLLVAMNYSLSSQDSAPCVKHVSRFELMRSFS